MAREILMIATVIITAYILCGLYAAGTTFAYFQKKFTLGAEQSYEEDLFVSLLFGICGPISAIVVFFTSEYNKYGWGGWVSIPRERKIQKVIKRLDR